MTIPIAKYENYHGQKTAQFCEKLSTLLFDHEKWDIDGERLIHDNGIWFRIDDAKEQDFAYLHVGISSSEVPFSLRMPSYMFTRVYAETVQKIRLRTAQEVIDQVSVMLELTLPNA